MMKIPLKDLRERRDITQGELAKILEVSPSTVGMWEQGRRQPDYDMLVKIAAFFGVTTDYLLGNGPVTLPIFPQSILARGENRLLEGFRALSQGGKDTLLTVLDSLRVTHAAR